MTISSNSTITNGFVPDFRLTNVTSGDVLIYSNTHRAFINNDGSDLNLTINSSDITNGSITIDHLSAMGGTTGQVLSIDNSGQLTWVTLSPTGATTILSDNTDVNDQSRVDGSALVFDGSMWVTEPFSVSGLRDTDLTSAINGDFLTLDGSTWKSKSISSLDLADFNVASPNTNDYLQWDGTAWTPSSIPLSTTELNDNTDVNTAALTGNDVLQWNGTEWVNGRIDYVDVTGTPDLSTYLVASDLNQIAFNGDWAYIQNPKPDWTTLVNVPDLADEIHTHVMADITDLSMPTELEDLNNVSTAAPNVNDYLQWDGASWSPSSTSLSLSTLSDTTITNAQNKQYLKYDGVDWINSGISASDIADFYLSVNSANGNLRFAYMYDTGTPSNGILEWNNGMMNYITTIPSTMITGLSDVALSNDYNSLDNIPLTYAPAPHTHVIGQLGDVNISSPAKGHVLTYSQTNSNWFNKKFDLAEYIGNGVTGESIVWDDTESEWTRGRLQLDSLVDVSFNPSPQDGHVLKYDGSKWVSSQITFSDIMGTQPMPRAHTHLYADILDFQLGVAAANNSLKFQELSDVGAPSDGFLFWDTNGVVYKNAIEHTSVTGLSAVASSGDYGDLIGTPVIPTQITQLANLNDTSATPVNNGWLRWNASGTLVEYKTSISATTDVQGLSQVATSGAYSDLSGKPTLAAIASTGLWDDIIDPKPSWSTLLNVPTSFNPAPHTHQISNVTGLQSILDSKIDNSVSSLPALSVDYDTQVTGNKPIVPTNGSFTFSGLSDTSSATPASRAKKYLRWDNNGLGVIYETNIDVAVITGLSTVAKTGAYSDLSGIPNLNNITVDYATQVTGNKPDVSIFAQSADLKPLAYTGNWTEIIGKPSFFDGKYSSLSGRPQKMEPLPHTHTAADISGIVVSLSLNDLTDVNALPTANGDVVSWDANGSRWIARPGSKVVGMLDVANISVPNGYLRWNTNGTKILFEENISATNITGLSTVATSGNISDANDVISTNVQDGQVLAWDETEEKWVNSNQNSSMVINSQVSTSYVVQDTDNGGVITIDSASPVNLVINDTLGKGFNFVLIQKGFGGITFTGSATLHNASGHTGTLDKYSMVTFISDIGGEFVFQGNTA